MLASVTLGAAFVSNGGSVPRRASLLVARGRQDDGALLTRIDECMSLDAGDVDGESCSVDEMQELYDTSIKQKRRDQRGRGGVAEGSASLYDEVARSLKARIERAVRADAVVDLLSAPTEPAWLADDDAADAADADADAALAALDAAWGAERDAVSADLRKAWKRIEMAEKGLSSEQIDAYNGAGLGSSADGAGSALARFLEAVSSGDEDHALSAGVIRDLGTPRERLSHELVERDADGDPRWLGGAEFVFVDEHACIGCGACAHTAPATFFLEPWHGRARAFAQGADSPAATEAALAVCPVACIHAVSFEELARLETSRGLAPDIVPLSTSKRDSDLNHRGGQDVLNHDCFANPGRSNTRGPRCPESACYNCPRYDEPGENPHYRAREDARAEKRARRLRAETVMAKTADL